MIMMFDRLASWFGKGRALREVEALDDRDLAELGLSRAEIQGIVAAPDSVTERLLDMAGRHGVTARDLAGHGHDVAGMVETCRSCASVGACRAFLADSGSDPAQAVFCPNHTTYEALRAAQG